MTYRHHHTRHILVTSFIVGVLMSVVYEPRMQAAEEGETQHVRCSLSLSQTWREDFLDYHFDDRVVAFVNDTAVLGEWDGLWQREHDASVADSPNLNNFKVTLKKKISTESQWLVVELMFVHRNLPNNIAARALYPIPTDGHVAFALEHSFGPNRFSSLGVAMQSLDDFMPNEDEASYNPALMLGGSCTFADLSLQD